MPWSRNMDWSIFYNTPDSLQSLYLSRLGMEKEKPSKAYLDALVKKHQEVIPFENIDVTDYKREISLFPKNIMEKVLVKRRGGFCFELNGLFCMFLRTLGFDAWMCPSRQLRHGETYSVPATHCGILVNLGRTRLFCDVGYGGPNPRGSIKIEKKTIQTVENEIFYLDDYGTFGNQKEALNETPSGWLTLVRISDKDERKKELPLITIGLMQCILPDLYGNSKVRSTVDTAYCERHASIKLPDGGFYDLTGNRLKIKMQQDIEVFSVVEKDIPEILQKYFKIYE